MLAFPGKIPEAGAAPPKKMFRISESNTTENSSKANNRSNDNYV